MSYTHSVFTTSGGGGLLVPLGRVADAFPRFRGPPIVRHVRQDLADADATWLRDGPAPACGAVPDRARAGKRTLAHADSELVAIPPLGEESFDLAEWHRVALETLCVDYNVVPVALHVTEAPSQACAPLTIGAGCVLRCQRPQLETGEVAAQDDVDHARDGLGPIQSRGTVLENLDSIDHPNRQRVEVDELGSVADPGKPVCRDTPPVQKNQRDVGAKPPKRD